MQVAEGIVAMHELTDNTGTATPILHRDIKPGNIVQKPNGEVVILDFGISRPENQSAATQARMTTMGTAEYMAKEQLLGSPVKQSDLYSIAATLYHLVMGVTLPSVYADRPAAVDKLPASWKPVFVKALDDEPRNRQTDVREFHDALRSLLPAALRNSTRNMARPVTARPTAPRTAPAQAARAVTQQPTPAAIAALAKAKQKRTLNWASLGLVVVLTILLAVAIISNSLQFGSFVFFAGLLTISGLRFFASGRKGFFPRLGMVVFGPLLLLWIVFQLAEPPKPVIVNPPTAQH
jgi:serine/threonine protein kinase